jgi:SAM-dependent methyltransferase
VHPRVQEQIHAIIRTSGVRPRRVLEVGGVIGPDSLLRCAELEGAARYCLNLVPMTSEDGITAVKGNANDMRRFADESFDLVLSNATLEHDRRFWLSVAEMHRVLAPGGLLVIGVPGYVRDPERDHGRATHTYRVHYRFDYYRFSEQACREVFFDGFDDVVVEPILEPPRLIGHGVKPPGARRRLRRGLRSVMQRTAPLEADRHRADAHGVRQRRHPEG